MDVSRRVDLIDCFMRNSGVCVVFGRVHRVSERVRFGIDLALVAKLS